MLTSAAETDTATAGRQKLLTLHHPRRAAPVGDCKGWRSLAAIAAGCAIPATAYVLWFHSWTGDDGLTDSGGVYLRGRMSSFAECSRINPPTDKRMPCLSQPLKR